MASQLACRLPSWPAGLPASQPAGRLASPLASQLAGPPAGPPASQPLDVTRNGFRNERRLPERSTEAKQYRVTVKTIFLQVSYFGATKACEDYLLIVSLLVLCLVCCLCMLCFTVIYYRKILHFGNTYLRNELQMKATLTVTALIAWQVCNVNPKSQTKQQLNTIGATYINNRSNVDPKSMQSQHKSDPICL